MLTAIARIIGKYDDSTSTSQTRAIHIGTPTEKNIDAGRGGGGTAGRTVGEGMWSRRLIDSFFSTFWALAKDCCASQYTYQIKQARYT